MDEEIIIKDHFRKLHVDLPPIHKEISRFWWLAGIALAVCFLAITFHYYAVYVWKGKFENRNEKIEKGEFTVKKAASY